MCVNFSFLITFCTWTRLRKQDSSLGQAKQFEKVPTPTGPFSVIFQALHHLSYCAVLSILFGLFLLCSIGDYCCSSILLPSSLTQADSFFLLLCFHFWTFFSASSQTPSLLSTSQLQISPCTLHHTARHHKANPHS